MCLTRDANQRFNTLISSAPVITIATPVASYIKAIGFERQMECRAKAKIIIMYSIIHQLVDTTTTDYYTVVEMSWQ